MVEKVLAEETLIGGYDTGNNKLKVSFLDSKGNIQSFAIPTVVAEAPVSKIELKSSKDSVNNDVDLLHVRIKSKSLNNTDQNKAWYVGDYAKNKDSKIEPVVNAEGKTEDKLSQANKKLHLIPLFTGMAVAALRSGKKKVNVPFSGGVPIEDFKTRGEAQILEMMYGEHLIEFIDGEYEGETVTIIINDGTINVEGVHSILALMFDIKNGEIVEIPELADKIGENFAINDLGAGTTDKALFEDGILNKEMSTNNDIGTNLYIDSILKKIQSHEKFDRIRDFVKDENGPFKTREEFIQTLIMPEISKVIDNPNYQPKFITKWGPVKNVDVTDIVVEEMERYAKDQHNDLMGFWLKTNTEKMIVVGGGVLFGYIGLRKLKEEEEDFIFPVNLETSAFITSRSYLIANYMEQLDKSSVAQN